MKVRRGRFATEQTGFNHNITGLESVIIRGGPRVISGTWYEICFGVKIDNPPLTAAAAVQVRVGADFGCSHKPKGFFLGIG